MQNFMKKWLNFDEMVTPKIINFLYWIILIGIIIASIFSIVGLGSLWRGLATLVLGIIVLRVYGEMIIIFFKIYQQVKRIADNLDNKSVQSRTVQSRIDNPAAPQ